MASGAEWGSQQWLVITVIEVGNLAWYYYIGRCSEGRNSPLVLDSCRVDNIYTLLAFAELCINVLLDIIVQSTASPILHLKFEFNAMLIAYTINGAV